MLKTKRTSVNHREYAVVSESRLTLRDLVFAALGRAHKYEIENLLNPMSKDEIIKFITSVSDKPVYVENWDDYSRFNPVRVEVPLNDNYYGAMLYIEKNTSEYGFAMPSNNQTPKWRRKLKLIKEIVKS